MLKNFLRFLVESILLNTRHERTSTHSNLQEIRRYAVSMCNVFDVVVAVVVVVVVVALFPRQRITNQMFMEMW